MKHDQLRHLRSLRLLLSQDKSPLGFFLAAGCPLSVQVAGKPLSPDMAGLSKIIADEHAREPADSPFNRLLVELGKVKKSVSNIEDVLTFIRSMKEVAGGGASVRGFSEAELTTLEKEICTTITREVNKELPEDDNSYRRLAKWVSAIDRKAPVEIFTTNYDLLIEQALEEQFVPFFDGFSGSRYPFFDIHSAQGNDLPPYWARLWKLHGSVNWKEEGNGVYRVSKDGGAGSPQLIYPSKLKYDQSRKMPFLAMSDRLTDFLLKDHAVLIICGYSFNDEHINDTIINALKVNQSANVIALMYGTKLDKSGKERAPEALKRAKERPNLNVWHDDVAVIGAQEYEWSEYDEDNKDFAGFNFNLVGKRVALGNFSEFTSFLYQLIGDHPDADKK